MYTKYIRNVCMQHVFHISTNFSKFCIQNVYKIYTECLHTECIPFRKTFVYILYTKFSRHSFFLHSHFGFSSNQFFYWFSRLIYLLLSLVLVFMSMIKVLWSGYFLPLSLYSCGSSMNTLDIIDASLLLQRPWSLVDFSLLLHVFTLVCLPTQHLGHFINCRCCISTISLNKKPPLLIILLPFTLPSGHCLF